MIVSLDQLSKPSRYRVTNDKNSLQSVSQLGSRQGHLLLAEADLHPIGGSFVGLAILLLDKKHIHFGTGQTVMIDR
jgi:hypothetical protein